MKIVIKIPDQKYKWIVDNPQTYTDDLCEIIRNGIPLCEDCRNCKKWDECPCGKEGHENGTSIGYSIGECKDYEPSVTPKAKTGHWIKLEPYPLQMHEYECSECGHETDDNTENYCSECGAKMESEDKE